MKLPSFALFLWLTSVVVVVVDADSNHDAMVMMSADDDADDRCLTDGTCSAKDTLYEGQETYDDDMEDEDEEDMKDEEDDMDDHNDTDTTDEANPRHVYTDEERAAYLRSYRKKDITDDMFEEFPYPEDNFLWYRTPFGFDQEVFQGEGFDHEKTSQILQDMKTYMMEKVLVDESLIIARDPCRMRHAECAHWATMGECENNPTFMSQECAPVCQTCHLLDVMKKCPFDPNTAQDAWVAPTENDQANGKTLNQMFERLITDPWLQQMYQPHVHSQDPWVVTLENFLTDDECDQMIQMGTQRGYQRSLGSSGEQKPDGSIGAAASEHRTSSNTWCVQESGCYDSPVARGIYDKIYNVTNGIPVNNYEHLQLLHYELGQFYKVHHDYFPEFIHRKPGVRILTVFLYLNDVPDGSGGGTRFPHLGDDGITIQPKKGRALLWPSVLHETPNEMDNRTDHEALPIVTDGTVKYAANAWIRQRDFITAFDEGCG